MNSKIQHGPDEIVEIPAETTEAGLLEAAARLANPSGYSLLDDKDEIQKEAK